MARIFDNMEQDLLCALRATLKVSIRQFAQDLIERCTDVALLKSFWFALAGRLPRKSNEKFRHGLSVLDPTCGSGAFLFAALNILKPLYDATLRTLQAVRTDALIAGEKSSPEKWAEVDELLNRFAAAGSERPQDYAVIKHIIVNNLYGVDIEKQATEIAKLRLFLKLVSLLEPGDAIEPLPDIDFNIRHGNTLVGYATADETEKAVRGTVGGKMVGQGNLLNDAWDEISVRLTKAGEEYKNFQIQQVRHGGHVSPADKQKLIDTLYELDETLNYHLATEYGINPTQKAKYEAWKIKHQPFHWYVSFYPLMACGGFDVVIGNPPFVEYAKIRREYALKDYRTEQCGNLYAFVLERAVELAGPVCRSGFVIPMAGITSRRTKELRNILIQSGSALHVSSYAGDAHPSVLFEGVRLRLAIVICEHARKDHVVPRRAAIFTTIFQRWYAAERDLLFRNIAFLPSTPITRSEVFPRLGGVYALAVWDKLLSAGTAPLATHLGNGSTVFYQEAAQYFVKASQKLPYFSKNGLVGAPPHGRFLNCSEIQAPALMALLSSTLFYIWYHAVSDCYHVSDAIVQAFPSFQSILHDSELASLGITLEERLHRQAKVVEISTGTGDKIAYAAFNYQVMKSVLDDIDRVIARHYGFNVEQVDFIINYDGKYRMGQLAQGNDD